MSLLHCFFGHDERSEAGTTAFVHSAISHSRKPIALVPITRLNIGDVKEGTNAFTFRRFLVPWAMRWTGIALFVDGSDMLCRADLNEIAEHWDYVSAVQVVKHDYLTKHQRKYVGTPMEADNADYARKNWCSVMLLNCAHYAWRRMTPDGVAETPAMQLLQLGFIKDRYIGDLPGVWNWLVDEHGENPDAKLLHFTAGSPGFQHYRESPMADEWYAALYAATSSTG